GTGGAFNVSGTHTYTTPGSFPISVVIKDSGGAQTGVLTSVNILPVTWTPPTPYSGPVSDPNTDLVSVGEAAIGINTSEPLMSRPLGFLLSPGTVVGLTTALIYS